MTEKEKIALMEEIMDLDEGTLTLDSVLDDIDEWDSVAILSYITEVLDKFGKTVKGSEVKKFVTVRDAVEIMQ